MTEEIKKNILDYITNNITLTQPEERHSFKDIVNLDPNDWTGDILPENYTEFKYNGIISPNENTSNLSILYGQYYDNVASQYRGIITLLNVDFKPIKSLFKYESNTYLRPILCLEQSDDNTFYGIDNSMANSPQDRFIMLNNFTIPNSSGNYVVDLRKTYNVPNNYYFEEVYKMYKSPYSSHYIIFGIDLFTIKVIELKIEVGSSPIWTPRTFSPGSDNYYYHNGIPIALFDEEENVFWRFVVLDYGTSGSSIKCISKNYTTSPVTTTIMSGTSASPIYELLDYAFKDGNNLFFGIDRNYTAETLYKYNFSNSSLTQVVSQNLSSTDYENIRIYVCNSEVYVCFCFRTMLRVTAFTRLINDQFVEWFYLDGVSDLPYNVEFFFVKANYNLVSIVAIKGDRNSAIDILKGGYILKDNYNVLNYNGSDYTDYNSLIPTQAEIYSNESLVFARDLSDSTILDNTTTSTMVVPNGYLNDVILNSQSLISETNSVITNSFNSITKNIYETCYFNFINTINTINNNYNNNQLISGTGAYINKNINVGTQENCLNSFIGKIVVNYENGTSMITDLFWTKINDTTAITEFALETNTAISTIEYKSNDLTTTYLTEVPKNIEVGKIYKFTQYLKIE